jgi:hypothetical protein
LINALRRSLIPYRAYKAAIACARNKVLERLKGAIGNLTEIDAEVLKLL